MVPTESINIVWQGGMGVHIYTPSRPRLIHVYKLSHKQVAHSQHVPGALCLMPTSGLIFARLSYSLKLALYFLMRSSICPICLILSAISSE